MRLLKNFIIYFFSPTLFNRFSALPVSMAIDTANLKTANTVKKRKQSLLPCFILPKLRENILVQRASSPKCTAVTTRAKGDFSLLCL